MNEHRQQLIAELNELYRRHYCKDGTCPCLADCRSGMGPKKFLCDYATRVGENYGQHFPKVVVLGQEGHNYHSEHTLPVDDIRNENNLHYRRTLYTLVKLFTWKEPDNESTAALKQYNKCLTEFCLTNYYKCAFAPSNKPVSKLKHSEAMQEHCGILLLDELNLLQPDLLIVQGKFVPSWLWDKLIDQEAVLYQNKNASVALYRHRNDPGRYVLDSYHPTGCGGWWLKTKQDLMNALCKFRSEEKTKF